MRREDEELYCQDCEGWNQEHLEGAGVFSVLDKCQRLDYELKNCRRDTVAGFGDTAEDLIVYLTEMKGKIETVILNLETELELDSD